jgi:hypothetical protein
MLFASELFADLLHYLFTLDRVSGQCLRWTRADRRQVRIKYNKTRSGPYYSESVQETLDLKLLDPGKNPSLTHTVYRTENGGTISAFDRLTFLLCHVFEAGDWQTILNSK